ncbi:MAG: GDP-L-fucose synthase [Alphaproteobacteria bacterium MarineAlpha5_Bin8]|nr:MAG: GDP-L-fucose synthase [Alphaproteobacteria bacterium MarineAlpha5_Bin7]PPR48276.1 MAG: GDP-L-fucose synthase [Alphaproteobacteria bacterium MarineAlpha5_Bin8]PPR55015.1 MAG: GDP-L-fucose synthase [Alphaproteobacteria bacterium MarineAlpha5_Bin6]|tara:strand:- start:2660 stop:3616 length:957 start_codon:yes stop_codon:yes gene_type:complete
MNHDSKIYIAGHTGMVGSALYKRLKTEGFNKLITATRDQLDLLNQKKTEDFIKNNKPELVILVAAKVGGILANSKYPADFLYENLTIQNNIIFSCKEANIKNLIFLGSSCIYPRNCEQPMKENMLMSGKLEETNKSYAIAKIAGINLCESISKQFGLNYFSIMPSNLYGPNDHFDSNLNHVIPALISKFHFAKINNEKKVDVWGSGNPKREFLYIDDLIDAIMHLIKIDRSELNNVFSKLGSMFLNVGYGEEIKIKDLVNKIAKLTDFDKEICYDLSMPDGTPKKLLDISNIKSLGWGPKTSLDKGLKITYDWFKQNL